MPGPWPITASKLATASRRDPWRGVRTALRYAVLLIVLTFCLFPILWVIGTSVKLPGEYLRNPPVWIPQNPTLVHFQCHVSKGNLALKNSVIIATGATFLSCSSAAWRPTAWRGSTPADAISRSGCCRSG